MKAADGVHERAIRVPVWERQGDGAVARPGGSSVPWPPKDSRHADDLKHALLSAQDEAARLGHNHIGPVHLLVGALSAAEGPAAHALGALSVTAQAARQALESIIGRGEAPFPLADITLTPHAQRVIEMANYESRRLAHATTATVHLLLALLEEREHRIMQVLAALGVDPADARDRLLAGVQVPPSYRVAEDADVTSGPYERFSDSSREVLAFAHEEAARFGHRGIGDEHLVIALARVAEKAPESALGQTLAGFGINVERLRDEVAKLQPGTNRAGATDLKFTPNVKLILELAINGAGAGGVVMPEHIFAALRASKVSIGLYVLQQCGMGLA